MLKFFQQKYKAGLFHPKALLFTLVAYFKYRNVLVKWCYLASKRSSINGIQEHTSKMSYQELLLQSLSTARHLKEKYQIGSSSKILIYADNSFYAIQAILACSHLGADLYFAKIDTSKEEMQLLNKDISFDLLITDIHHLNRISGWAHFNKILYTKHLTFDAINNINVSNYKSKVKGFNNGHFFFQDGGRFIKKSFADLKAFKNLYLEHFELADFETIHIGINFSECAAFNALITAIYLKRSISISSSNDYRTTGKNSLKSRANIIYTRANTLNEILMESKLELIYLKRVICVDKFIPIGLKNKILNLIGPKLYQLFPDVELNALSIAHPSDLIQFPNTCGRLIKDLDYSLNPNNDGNGNLLIRWKDNDFQPNGFFCLEEDYLAFNGFKDQYIIEEDKKYYFHQLEDKISGLESCKRSLVQIKDGKVKISIQLLSSQEKEAFKKQLEDAGISEKIIDLIHFTDQLMVDAFGSIKEIPRKEKKDIRSEMHAAVIKFNELYYHCS